MTADPFHGSKIKIERAYHHLVGLQKAEVRFFADNAADLIIEDDPQGPNKLAKLRLDAPIPDLIHVVAGEAIYQLRSALDHIAVDLGRISALRPNIKNIYFPTGDGLTGFEASRNKNLAGIDHDLIEQIDQLQPYNGGNDDLRAVFAAANIDKHLELIACGPAGIFQGLTRYRMNNCKFLVVKPGPLNSGVVVAEILSGGEIAPIDSNAKVHASGIILLDNVAPYSGQPLVPFLVKLANATRDAHEKIVKYCRRTNRI